MFNQFVMFAIRICTMSMNMRSMFIKNRKMINTENEEVEKCRKTKDKSCHNTYIYIINAIDSGTIQISQDKLREISAIREKICNAEKEHIIHDDELMRAIVINRIKHTVSTFENDIVEIVKHMTFIANSTEYETFRFDNNAFIAAKIVLRNAKFYLCRFEEILDSTCTMAEELAFQVIEKEPNVIPCEIREKLLSMKRVVDDKNFDDDDYDHVYINYVIETIANLEHDIDYCEDHAEA